ncbi:hypothetical protein BYT27DRAFT_7259296 [Phlegmacium glaucopus]|nr:hypothetical protein BYT27DRAFT_7259296 [Phlegmacium glaucopus]
MSPDRDPVPSTSSGPSSTAPPSTAPPSSASTPAWMMPGTFSHQNATPECIRPTQPSSLSSFQPWHLDSSSGGTATTNERRMNAAQRHQPTPHGLPVPAWGIAQNPLTLGPLPTIALPRVTTTRTATRSARNPGSRVGTQALSSQSHAPKSIDYKFACVILPTSLNGFTSKTGIFIQSGSIHAPVEGKSRLFFAKAEHLHLSFIFQVQASQEDLIVNALNECLKKHMDLHKLSLVLENQQSHLFSPSSTPSLSPELPWQILYAKQTQRTPRYSLPLNPFPTADMKRLTFKKLWELMVNRHGERRIPAVTIDDEPHQLLLIVPTHNIIVGPLKGQEGKLHKCLSERLWFGFREVDMNEGLDEEAPTCNHGGLSCKETEKRVCSIPPTTSNTVTSTSTIPAVPRASENIPIDPRLLDAPLPTSAMLEPDESLVPAPVDLSDNPNQQELPVVASRLGRQVSYLATESIKQLAGDTDDDTLLTVISTSTDEAADALYPRLRQLFFTGKAESLPPSSATFIHNLDIKALDKTKISASIGEGVGYGPTRSTWSTVISRIVSNTSHWMEAADGYYTPTNMMPLSSFIWGLDPFPISPFFIAVVLADLNSATSSSFINTVSPLSSLRLATWPPPEIIGRIEAMSATQRQQLTPFIKYAHLFRVTLQGENTNNTLLNPLHPLVTAFKKGVLHPPFKTQLNLQRIFVTCVRPIDLIISLYQGCQIIEPDQVIDRIEVNAVPKEVDGYDDDIHHQGMVKRFRRLLKGYLKGLGHPKGSQKLGISPAAIEANKNDNHLRPQYFVEAMTASSYLPIHNGKLNINLLSHMPAMGSSASAIASHSGAHFHTCFSSVDVIMDKVFATNLLAYEQPDVPTENVNQFEEWIHSLVLKSTKREGDFNNP